MLASALRQPMMLRQLVFVAPQVRERGDGRAGAWHCVLVALRCCRRCCCRGRMTRWHLRERASTRRASCGEECAKETRLDAAAAAGPARMRGPACAAVPCAPN